MKPNVIIAGLNAVLHPTDHKCLKCGLRKTTDEMFSDDRCVSCNSEMSYVHPTIGKAGEGPLCFNQGTIDPFDRVVQHFEIPVKPVIGKIRPPVSDYFPRPSFGKKQQAQLH